jgi:hypothetical protein
MKQACGKIRDMFTRAIVLRSIGQLIYLSNSPDKRCPPIGPNDVPRDWSLLYWAKETNNSVKRSIPGAATFWKYFNKEPIPKAKMWLTGMRNIPHADQDTTTTIESYHGNIKAVLRQFRGKLVGRRVDWLIHQLTGVVINRYNYMQFRKENGFVTNKKGRVLMLSALTQSQKILDSNVHLPASEGEPAFVRLSKRSHLEYAMYNPCTEWVVGSKTSLHTQTVRPPSTRSAQASHRTASRPPPPTPLSGPNSKSASKTTTTVCTN